MIKAPQLRTGQVVRVLRAKLRAGIAERTGETCQSSPQDLPTAAEQFAIDRYFIIIMH